MVRVIIVMGVAGAGKTAVGVALAKALGWEFHDADTFHSPENVAKMHRGHALTDADRLPWLHALQGLIDQVLAEGGHAVLACSALKQWYRDLLTPADEPDTVRFVYLDVPEPVLRERLEDRGHHFVTPELLPSQLATLEPPKDALWVDGTRSVTDIVEQLRAKLGL